MVCGRAISTSIVSLAYATLVALVVRASVCVLPLLVLMGVVARWRPLAYTHHTGSPTLARALLLLRVLLRWALQVPALMMLLALLRRLPLPRRVRMLTMMTVWLLTPCGCGQ